jgi:hypothetical protein
MRTSTRSLLLRWARVAVAAVLAIPSAFYWFWGHWPDPGGWVFNYFVFARPNGLQCMFGMLWVGMGVDFVVFLVFWYLDLGLVRFLWRAKFRSST